MRYNNCIYEKDPSRILLHDRGERIGKRDILDNYGACICLCAAQAYGTLLTDLSWSYVAKSNFTGTHITQSNFGCSHKSKSDSNRL